jgi:DNA-binding XRE family transcriptional regulator
MDAASWLTANRARCSLFAKAINVSVCVGREKVRVAKREMERPVKRERRFAPASRLKKSAIDKYIGSRMRESRLSLNISQEALGKALGISFQQIQSYERGANGVSAVRLFEICKILNVSLSFMFQRDSKNGSTEVHVQNVPKISSRILDLARA